jgi:hypothetical protein
MVDEGHAKALDDAASILDLQEIIIHPPEACGGAEGEYDLATISPNRELCMPSTKAIFSACDPFRKR